MNTYTYKCPGCGAALEFDPKAQLMICNHCGQMYLPSDVSVSDDTSEGQMASNEQGQGAQGYAAEEQTGAYGYNEQGQGAQGYAAEEQTGAYGYNEQGQGTQGYAAEEQTDTYGEYNADYIDVNVYNCGSCGAQIMTNDVEVTKTCLYCGQPTIMFDRVSRERKPDKVIPFMLTKEQALAKAKAKFSTAKFLADGIENVTATSVYGIYMPYFGYDVDMKLSLEVGYTYDKKKIRKNADVGRRHIVLLDASERFNDYVSMQLNPYPIQSATAFDPVYLTGFYADRNDVLAQSREEDAKDYLREILIDEAIDSMPGAPEKEIRELYKDLYEKTGSLRVDIEYELAKLMSCEYYFCPVYFITFNVAGKHIILLVNGATGKVVGTIPVDENKLQAQRKTDRIIFAAIFGVIGALVFGFMPIWWAAMLFAIIVGSFVVSGASAKKKYNEMYTKTNSEAMFDLSRNRE